VTSPRTLTALSICYALLVYIPWWTNAPLAGLDASWEWMLHWAASSGQQMGTDIIWPYGPLGYVFAPQYHPDSFAGLLFVRAALTFSLCSAAYAAFSPLRSPARAWCFALFIVSAGFTLDALYVSLLLLFIHLNFFRYQLPIWVMHLLIIALALASLVKFSVLLMCVCACIMLSLWQLKKRIPPYALLGYITALCTLWAVCEQSFEHVIPYVQHSFALSSFFGTMAKTSSVSHLICFVTACLMLGVLYGMQRRTRAYLPYALTMAGIAFLSYKAGFTRHDALRSLLPFIVLLQLFLLYAWHCHHRVSKLLWGVGMVIAMAGSTLLYQQFSTPQHRHNSYTPIGFWQRIHNDAAQARQSFITSQQQRLPLKVAQSSADIYMHEIAPLLAHDDVGNLHYAPRPIVQSYSAYSPALQRLNAEHLVSANAAHLLLIELLTIDNRYPSIEDAPSWLKWLEFYDYAHTITSPDGRAFAVLKRRKMKRHISIERLEVAQDYAFNTVINVPKTNALWATISVTPTIIGTITSFLYKAQMLALEATLADGSIITHRIIPEMMQHGFLLSPYVSSTPSLVDFLTSQNNPSQHVISMRIIGETGARNIGWFYHKPTISFERIMR
jgi:hypothetical protein